MDKKSLSERHICTKFISPALVEAGWDAMSQIREEVTITKGRITVRGKLVSRGKAKRADYVLYYKSKIPIAIVEAKDNNHAVGDGIQQAIGYAESLDVPFAFSSNGIVSYTSQPLTERPSVIVGRKGSAGALNISKSASWTTDVAYYIECPENYDLKFLYILLDSLNLPSFAKGVKPGLSRKDIKGLTINVPPLEEQKEIVIILDELMKVCDQLENSLQDEEAIKSELLKTLVA